MTTCGHCGSAFGAESWRALELVELVDATRVRELVTRARSTRPSGTAPSGYNGFVGGTGAHRSEPDIRSSAIAQVLAEERERGGRVAAVVRLVACLGGMPVAFVVGRAQPILVLLSVYAALGIALATAIRFSRRASRASWLGILLLDVPFVLASRFQYFSYGTDSAVQAGLLVAFALLLVVAASVTLHRTAVVLTAVAAAAVCAGALALMGGGAWIAQMLLVLAVGASTLVYVETRMRTLIRRFAAEQVRRDRLERYFSPAVAAHVMATTTSGSQGDHRDVTVLFADIRNFTAMSEAMDGGEIVKMVDEYLSLMAGVVLAHGGTLDKFLGDGLLAYFGAPAPQADHAIRGVACALSMQEELLRLNAMRVARGQRPLVAGHGVHSGRVVAGTIGTEQRREFTIIGDTVNVASRVEGLTKQLAVPILVTEQTRERVGAAFAWTAMPAVEVKGKVEPLRTFTPSRLAGAESDPRLLDAPSRPSLPPSGPSRR